MTRNCKLDECRGEHYTKGFCKPHYYQDYHSNRQENDPKYVVRMCWASIKARCNNPENKSYHNYGGRGIEVCGEWLNDFDAFYAHIGDKPSSRHSIDRIDNDRGYEPGNVRWADWSTQLYNRRKHRRNTSGYKGVSWRKKEKVFAVSLSTKMIGTYKRLEDAVKARKDAEEQLFNGGERK